MKIKILAFMLLLFLSNASPVVAELSISKISLKSFGTSASSQGINSASFRPESTSGLSIVDMNTDSLLSGKKST
jgi:hypothetical protein